MDEPKYFKAACVHCGNNIEFPDAALGRMVDCPHCGQRTQLRAAKPPGPPEPARPATLLPPEEAGTLQPSGSRSRMGLVIVAGCAIVALAAGVFFWKGRPTQPAPSATTPKGKETLANASAANHTSAPTNTPSTATPPAVPTQPKALSDLKAGDIQLEKAQGSSLVYAVGQLNNDSDYQRFGVRIQLDMLNQAGKKISTAQDYTQILEPRKSWRFRALVVDSKAVSARVAAITEE